MLGGKKNAIIIATTLLVLSFAALLWMKTAQPGGATPPFSFEVSSEDAIVSWEWKGPYADGGALEAKARNEIARLEALFGNPENDPTDYILHVSIANQHHLLGEGEAEFASLRSALSIDSTETGLAWRNMGALMEQLGAFSTAREAYRRAVEAQGQIVEYHVAYITLLLKHFREDTRALELALQKADAEFDDLSEIEHLRATLQ